MHSHHKISTNFLNKKFQNVNHIEVYNVKLKASLYHHSPFYITPPEITPMPAVLCTSFHNFSYVCANICIEFEVFIFHKNWIILYIFMIPTPFIYKYALEISLCQYRQICFILFTAAQ